MGIKHKTNILYTLKDLHKKQDGVKRFKPHKKYALSVFNSKECDIFINIRKHITAADLLDTIVHELVHIKYPKIAHGREFQNKIDKIVMNERI